MSREVLDFHERVRSTLATYVAGLGLPAGRAHEADALFGLELAAEDGHKASLFLLLARSSGAHDRFPAEQTFQVCSVVGEPAHGHDGTILQFVREVHVRPHPQLQEQLCSPLTGIYEPRSGELKMMSEDEVATWCCTTLGATGAGAPLVAQLEVSIMGYEDVAPDRLRLRGLSGYIVRVAVAPDLAGGGAGGDGGEGPAPPWA